MGIKSNLLIKATKYNDKSTIKFVLDFYSVLDKFSSALKKKESFNSKNNELLDHALLCAIENLSYDIIELLINSGANIHSLNR
ncbi:MAG: hypothetical protein PV340_01725 [Wolbachia sp.]|nr:hypothetical protein [Wolbachia sp.]MDD9336654.1 hypothetical protein [Wolbachia sp.]